MAKKREGKRSHLRKTSISSSFPSSNSLTLWHKIHQSDRDRFLYNHAAALNGWSSNVQGIHLELKILSILFHHFLRQFTIAFLDVLQLLLVICNEQNSFFAKYQESFLTLLSWSNVFHNVCFPHQNKSPFNRASE